MSITKFIKDLLRKPESIPTLGAIFYNATVAKVLRKPEAKIADGIVEKVKGGLWADYWHVWDGFPPKTLLAAPRVRRGRTTWEAGPVAELVRFEEEGRKLPGLTFTVDCHQAWLFRGKSELTVLYRSALHVRASSDTADPRSDAH